MMRYWMSGVLGAGLLLGGCVQVSDPQERLEVDIPAAWDTEADLVFGAEGWLADFGDVRLEELVAEALEGNPGLEAGMARLEQAQALARIEGADRWPDLGLSGTARRQMTNSLSEPLMRMRSDRFDLGASVNWELDLWGRVRAQTEAAASDAIAAAGDYAALRLSLGTRVAQAWFAAIEARQQELLARETVRSFRTNLTTVEERFRRGLSPALDLRLTRANVASAESSLAQRKRLTDAAVRQLEVLLGRYPRGDLSVEAALPVLEGTVPAGLPAGLLDRRPDIRAAADRVRAADARVMASRRALLPAINLTGSYGRASAELDDLLDNSFDVWSLVGGLAAPIFQGGRLRANVDRSEAVLAERMASYRDIVLTALREVESALSGEEYLREQLEALRRSAEESTGAQELAEERYERGLVDIITVLESQRRAFTSRSALITAENLLLQNRLSLYLSLGGGLR